MEYNNSLEPKRMLSFNDYMRQASEDRPTEEVSRKSNIKVTRVENEEDDTESTELSDNNDNNSDQEDSRDDTSNDDPDRQGAIRTVEGAHLVYKRQSEDGTYEELWIYRENDDFHNEIEIKRAIVAGTDIEVDDIKDEESEQKVEMWAAGNIQMIKLSNLQN